VNLIERVGLDEELPTIVRTIGWGKLYVEPRLGSPSGAPVGHWVWGGYLGHHEGSSYYPSHGYLEPNFRAGTSASARYPDWYAPLERHINYGADQAERVVEGIG
jgi:hypothetical protein